MKNLHQISATELIATLLTRFPDSFAEANATRERIKAADDAFNPETNAVAGSIIETIRLLRLRTDQLRNPVDASTVKLVNGDISEAPTERMAPAPATTEMPAGSGPAGAEPAAAPAAATAAERPPETSAQPAEPTPAAPAPAAESTSAAAASAAAAPAEEPAPAREIHRWSDRERLLYRDIIHLFELGDHAGAMASLERLFMLVPDAEELSVFLRKNESTLLRLYRDHVGSMDRVTVPARGRKPVRIPTPDADLMLKIIRMSDGHRQLREFVKRLEAPELHILVVVSHLIRSGYLELA